MATGIPPLESEIRRLIEVAGPMPVSHFMSLSLAHPEYGYYITRDPLGTAGDFTTAPEISQMFGELIGLWAAAVWRLIGAPPQVSLVELGPGRGTMMLDALRAAQVMREFREALSVHLVETGPALQRRQRQTLGGIDVPVTWHETLQDVPEGPAIIVANEFFDALPVHQVVKQEGGWYERVVGIDGDGNLAFGIGGDPIPVFDALLPERVREAPIGAIFEWRSDSVILEIGRRVAGGSSAALAIDYGHAQSDAGDTLQAIGKHAYADPLSEPGEIDLTAHVDFQALAQAAESIGARVHGPIEQGTFLRRLGIERRANALKSVVPPDKAEEIDTAVMRLTGSEESNMGRMFKAIGFSGPEIKGLPGFES